MDYLNLIKTIIANLRRSGEDEYANQVDEAFSYSFTSSELLLKVTHELLKILKEERNLGEHKVIALLEQDVTKLNAFCNSIGLYPH